MMSAAVSVRVAVMTDRAAASTETTRAGAPARSVVAARPTGARMGIARPIGVRMVTVLHTGVKAAIARNVSNAATAPRASVRRTGAMVETVRSALSVETGRIVATVHPIVDRMESAPAIPSVVTALRGRTAVIARPTGVRKAAVRHIEEMKVIVRAALIGVIGRSAVSAPGRRGVNIHRAVRTGATGMTIARAATSGAVHRRTSCLRP